MRLATDIGLKITSHTGAVWDLMAGTEGAILTNGLAGVHLPEMSQIVYKTARSPGGRFEDVRWDTGELTMEVTVADTWVNRPSGAFRRRDEFLMLDREFRDSFCPYHEMIVEFTALGQVRTFRGRLTGLERQNADFMPDTHGRADYEIELTPESPFFHGKPLVYDFPYTGSDLGDNYYGPDNEAPDFHITQGSAVSNVTVTNPGQVECWPKWTVDGPGQAVVGIGDHLTTITMLNEGERIVVDTDPSTGGVWDESGDRAWDRLGPLYNFAPIHHASTIDATAQLISAGPGANIRLEIPSLFRSAW